MIIYYLPPCTRTSKIHWIELCICHDNSIHRGTGRRWRFRVSPDGGSNVIFKHSTCYTQICIIIYVIKHICMYLYQKIQSHYWQYNKSSENNMPNVWIIRSYVICVLYQDMDSLCCIWTQWLVERTHHRLIFWGFPHADLFGTVPSIYADVGEKCS